MSFWVRSQDKRNLVEIERFIVAGTKVKGYSRLMSLGITLGKYSSNDRAMSVLESIQKKISAAAGEHIFYEMPGEM